MSWVETKDRLPTKADSSDVGHVLAWNSEAECWRSYRWDHVHVLHSPAWKPLAPYKPPTPEYRPFTRDEFLPNANRWLKDRDGDYFNIQSIYSNGVFINGGFYAWATLLDCYTFADDKTPCGVPVDG